MRSRDVLVAAGDRFIGDALINILKEEKQGKEIHFFDNGIKALESILEIRPSFIILDLCLPGLNGRAILYCQCSVPIISRYQCCERPT